LHPAAVLLAVPPAEIEDRQMPVPNALFDVPFEVEMGETAWLGTIAAGAEDVLIEIDSDEDVDLELWAGDLALVGFEIGALLDSAGASSVTWGDVTISWSGWGGGDEYIFIDGIVTESLSVSVTGFVAGEGMAVALAGAEAPDAPPADPWPGPVPGPLPTDLPEGPDGTAAFDVGWGESVAVGVITAGATDVLIDLSSLSDIDLQLWADAVALVGYATGAELSGASQQSVDWNGATVTYSGYNGDGGGVGEEFIFIEGTLTQDLTILVSGFEAGAGDVTWTAGSDAPGDVDLPEDVPTGAQGAADFDIAWGEVAVVGVVTAGATDVLIDLSSVSDIDLELLFGATALVGFATEAPLSGASQQSFDWNGVTITYSGYNGDGGGYGEEFIFIDGTLTEDLTIQVSGFQAGAGSVDWAENGTLPETPGPSPSPEPEPTPLPGTTPEPAPGTSETVAAFDVAMGDTVEIGTIAAGASQILIDLDSAADVEGGSMCGSSKKWPAPSISSWVMVMPFCSCSLSTRMRVSCGLAKRSAVPLMIRPEDGQGARKEKSYMFAGGETEMKPVISGRRIRSCMPIQAPKEKPATQQCFALGFIDCR
jgi:hypothetical protein